MPTRPPSLSSKAKPPRQSWKRRAGTTTERGYGWTWQKLRARILARDRHLCQPCQRRGDPVPADDVDHVTPKHLGGTDDEGNLQAICHRCHQAKTAQEGREARR